MMISCTSPRLRCVTVAITSRCAVIRRGFDVVQAHADTGVITSIHAAPSDEGDCCFVQQRVVENASLIWQLISERGAHVYVCGSALRMAHGVYQVYQSALLMAVVEDAHVVCCVRSLAVNAGIHLRRHGARRWLVGRRSREVHADPRADRPVPAGPLHVGLLLRLLAPFQFYFDILCSLRGAYSLFLC